MCPTSLHQTFLVAFHRNTKEGKLRLHTCYYIKYFLFFFIFFLFKQCTLLLLTRCIICHSWLCAFIGMILIGITSICVSIHEKSCWSLGFFLAGSLPNLGRNTLVQCISLFFVFKYCVKKVTLYEKFQIGAIKHNQSIIVNQSINQSKTFYL